MRARRRAPVFVVIPLAMSAAPNLAEATDRGCPGPAVVAEAAFAARYPELLARLSRELDESPDLDACARIELGAGEQSDLEVRVLLPDGRTASRSVARQEDVLPAAQALLLVPEPGPGATPPAPAPESRPAPRPAKPLLYERERAEPAAPSEPEPRDLGLELSLLLGARMGDGHLNPGLGALSLLEAQGWLFGFVGRVDRYRTPETAEPSFSLELGALGGKRFHFRSFALDVVAGPAVATTNFSSNEADAVHVERGMPPAEASVINEESSAGAVPRLLVAAHAGFTPRSVLRSFVGLEASAGPAASDDAPNRRSSGLPVFALGVVLGGTLGTR